MADTIRRRRRLLYAGVALAALAVLTHWFFHAGVLMKGDVVFHLNRIMGIASGLAAGDFPVYVHGFQMLGYGTLDGALYPDLLLYLPAALVVSGVPLALAYHAYWIFVICLGFFAAWRGFALLSGRAFLGLLAALLYASSFYAMIFLGSGPGGYAALFFLPYAVGALSFVLRRADGARHWPELVLAVFVIAGSHVISAVLSAVVLAACLILWRRGLAEAARRRAVALASFFSFALLLYRLVPFVYFYRHVDFRISHPWFVPSLATLTNRVADLVATQFWWGWPLVILLGMGLLSRSFRRRRSFLAVAALILLLTAGIWSGFPWRSIERLPVLSSVLPLFQFSFRFLLLGLVPLAYYGARVLAAAVYAAARCWGEMRSDVVRALALLLALLAAPYGMYAYTQAGIRMGGQWADCRIAYAAYTPQTLPSYGALINSDYTYADFNPAQLFAAGAVPQPGEVRARMGEIAVSAFSKTGTRLSFSYTSPTGAEAEVPLVFYPGYVACIDGAPLAVREGAHHVLTLALPAGDHTVSVQFRGPWSFRASAWGSLLAFVLFCLISWRLWRGRRACDG